MQPRRKERAPIIREKRSDEPQLTRGMRDIVSYFPAGGRLRSNLSRQSVDFTLFTSSKRLLIHDDFLRKHSSEIKVFADIGAANKVGAPTAFDAKEALGDKARVVAVDIQKLDRKRAEEILKLNKMALAPDAIEELLHAIARKPLPFQCDAIRLATVSIYLSESERRRALVNIWKSLKPGGYLLGALMKSQFVLQKTETGFRMVLDWDNQVDWEKIKRFF